jgi:PAS domain-containing protein
MPSDRDLHLEAMGQAVMGLGSEVVFLADRATLRLLAANRAFSNVLGYAQEEVDGLSLFDLAGVEADRVRETVTALEQRGEQRLGVVPHRRKDGAVLDLDTPGSTRPAPWCWATPPSCRTRCSTSRSTPATRWGPRRAAS